MLSDEQVFQIATAIHDLNCSCGAYPKNHRMDLPGHKDRESDEFLREAQAIIPLVKRAIAACYEAQLTTLNELQLVEQRVSNGRRDELLRVAQERKEQWERAENAEARVAELEAQRDAILQESRTWAMEAKTQRQTVNEVCSVLGGIADWGPVVERVAELEADRDRLRVGLRRVLEDVPWHWNNTRRIINEVLDGRAARAKETT